MGWLKVWQNGPALPSEASTADPATKAAQFAKFAVRRPAAAWAAPSARGCGSAGSRLRGRTTREAPSVTVR